MWKKAFLQLGLKQADSTRTRFFWLQDCNKPINVIYRFARVPFGVVSPPFLVMATLFHHLKQTDKPTSKEVLQNFYVDNALI